MKVWLPRSSEDNERIRDLCATWLPSDHLLSLPVLSLKQLPVTWPEPQPSKLVFLSRPAVTYAHSAGLHIPKTASCYAVGPSTASEVSKHFQTLCLHPSPYNADELLQAYFQTSRRRNEMVWVLKGEGGREDLVSKLLERGFCATNINLYRRDPRTLSREDLKRLTQFDPDCVVVSSSAQLKVVLEVLLKILASTDRLPTLLLVASRLQKEALNLGYSGPMQLCGPLPQDVNDALRRLSGIDPDAALH